MGNILAVNLGGPDSHANEEYRCVMQVVSILSLIQTTRFYGNTMLVIGVDIGSIPASERFKQIVMSLGSIKRQWAELPAVPPPPQFLGPQGSGYSLLAGYPSPAPAASAPDAAGILTVAGAGFDQLKGYWVEFNGNYDLDFPIFKGRSVTRIR